MGKTDAGTVLVVDDDPEMLDLLSLVLQVEGYTVRTALDGEQALLAVGEAMPELILLDMKMPVMNGWEFARVFRERHDRAAPIVVVTAAHNARRTSEEIGADDYLGKPFDVAVLKAKVARRMPGGAGAPRPDPKR
jgi:DNA-binding response OmpR family regulator